MKYYVYLNDALTHQTRQKWRFRKLINRYVKQGYMVSEKKINLVYLDK